jgi:dTDP-4-amino-4,6-dideoxygalactose transaminase
MVPVNICEVVVATILHAGMKPVFHDVSSISGNCELSHLQDACTSDVVAWIAVHNYGTPLDLLPMLAWAKSFGVFVIEDICNSLGATINNRQVGTFGDAAIYSFGYAKIIEVGQGGAVSVPNAELLSKVRNILKTLPVVTPEHRNADLAFQCVLRLIRQHRVIQKPSIYRALYDEYMTHMLFMPDEDLCSNIRKRVTELPENIKQRKAKAARYRQELDLPAIRHRPMIEGDIYWRYTFLVPKAIRNGLLKELRSKNIPASSWFAPVNVLFDESADIKKFKGARAFGQRVVNLWVNEQTNYNDIERAGKIIKNYLRKAKHDHCNSPT